MLIISFFPVEDFPENIQPAVRPIHETTIKKKQQPKLNVSHLTEFEKTKYSSLSKLFNEPVDDIVHFDARAWMKCEKGIPHIANIIKKQTICLAAQFKCMSANCPFVTSDQTKMEDHLSDHSKLIDILDDRGELKNLKNNKDNKLRSFIMGWHHCAYCKYN